MVEAQRRSSARVLQRLSGERFVMAVDEAGRRRHYIIRLLLHLVEILFLQNI